MHDDFTTEERHFWGIWTVKYFIPWGRKGCSETAALARNLPVSPTELPYDFADCEQGQALRFELCS